MDEELLSRQQPQSLEAEQAVLGSILIDSRCITDVVGIVKPEDFYLQQNREIYEAIYTMFNFSQTIDPVTVLDKLKELGYYHDNSRDYILQLMEITPTAANVARYVAIVQEKSMLRGLRIRPRRTFSRWCRKRWVRPPRCWNLRKRKFTPCARASEATLWSTSARRCTRCSTA